MSSFTRKLMLWACCLLIPFCAEAATALRVGEQLNAGGTLVSANQAIWC
jgi:hypothetical protein